MALFFFFNDTATTEIYTLSLHDALPIFIVEGTETVVVTLQSISSGNAGISIAAANSATVNITDNDTATVSIAKISDAVEPGTNGKFRVTQSLVSSTDTVVSYTVSGTATAGS